jgi:hypothetical protein
MHLYDLAAVRKQHVGEAQPLRKTMHNALLHAGASIFPLPLSHVGQRTSQHVQPHLSQQPNALMSGVADVEPPPVPDLLTVASRRRPGGALSAAAVMAAGEARQEPWTTGVLMLQEVCVPMHIEACRKDAHQQ